MKDIISIIIPVYNVEKYIIRCLDSICSQNYSNIEIIIVDDGSTDASFELCKQMADNDSRIKLYHQENQGVVAARNYGMQQAKGKYLAFVDGDDWIEQDMISYMYENIGDTDLISVGAFREIHDSMEIEYTDKYEKGDYYGEKLKALYSTFLYDNASNCVQRLTPWIWNKLYNLEKAKIIHSKLDSSLTFAEDSIFLYQYILDCKKIVISDKCFYHYCYRDDSAIHKADSEFLAKVNKVYLELLPIFKKYPQYDLVYQLQSWVKTCVCRSVSDTMNFDDRVSIPQYIIDMKPMIGNKNVIYGAGGVGKALKKQAEYFGYDIVLWVDKQYEKYQQKGFDVASPEIINNIDFDYVIIAVESPSMAEMIREDLALIGVEKDKIVKSAVMRLF